MATFFDSSDAFSRAFIKMHGLRNHFIIVDARDDAYRPDAATVARLCDAQAGIGADQLVVIEKPVAAGADAFMRLYNVDGREVGACGNATRCVAWLLLEERNTDRVGVETLAGVLECRRSGDKRVTCDMGLLRSGWRDIPLSQEMNTRHLDFAAAGMTDGIAVNIGNPHVVFFVRDVAGLDIEAVAVAIQNDVLFPEQVNVGFARIRNRASIDLNVYERGVGLTMACGSGASAAVWAAHTRGLVGAGPVEVVLPGGSVQIEITADDHAIMTGPVAYSFRGFLG